MRLESLQRVGELVIIVFNIRRVTNDDVEAIIVHDLTKFAVPVKREMVCIRLLITLPNSIPSKPAQIKIVCHQIVYTMQLTSRASTETKRTWMEPFNRIEEARDNRIAGNIHRHVVSGVVSPYVLLVDILLKDR